MSKVNTGLKITIAILGIILIILIRLYGFTDCDKLVFNYHNQTLDARGFMQVYSDTCLEKDFKISSPLSLPNLTSLP